MNNNSKSYKLAIGIITVFVLVTILFTGCVKKEASSGDGVISDITISTDVDSNNRPINPTTVFSTDAAGFYCSFKVSGFPVGSTLLTQWIYLGGDPEAELITGKNYVAEAQTATITKVGSGYTSTAYTQLGIPDYTWPKGDYQVLITVNGVEEGSAYFKVQ